jgi:hypothetical protein
LSSRRGLAALRENPPVGRRLVRYCSVCGAVWTTIFSRLAAKEDFTVSLGYRPATIADLKFSKFNKHGARPRLCGNPERPVCEPRAAPGDEVGFG